MADERYLEDDGKLHKKLIVSCDLATEREDEPEDDEATQALIRHERMLLSA